MRDTLPPQTPDVASDRIREAQPAHRLFLIGGQRPLELKSRPPEPHLPSLSRGGPSQRYDFGVGLHSRFPDNSLPRNRPQRRCWACGESAKCALPSRLDSKRTSRKLGSRVQSRMSTEECRSSSRRTSDEHRRSLKVARHRFGQMMRVGRGKCGQVRSGDENWSACRCHLELSLSTMDFRARCDTLARSNSEDALIQFPESCVQRSLSDNIRAAFSANSAGLEE